MSKSITIQEGGYGKNLTVDKLRTNLSEGGTCLWVPEDAVGLTTKHISENGTYPATSDGAYGYSVVYVNVPGGPGGPASDTPGSVIIGTDPEDGEEYAYETVDDGEGGTEVKKTLMPSGIVITTPPTKLSYTDGETIDFSGIVVKLRKASGDFYTDENYPDSVIPFAELTFPVTVAHDPGSHGTTIGDTVVDGETVYGPIIRGSVMVGDSIGYASNGDVVYLSYGPSTIYSADGVINGAEAGFVAVSNTEGRGFSWRTAHAGGAGITSYYTFNQKTVYYCPLNYLAVSTPSVDGAFPNQTASIGKIAWAMLYGEEIPEGIVSIPVQWTPPASKFPAQKTRSTSFEITVTAGSGGTTVDDDGFSGHDGDF